MQNANDLFLDQILRFLFIFIQVPLVAICIAGMWEQNVT